MNLKPYTNKISDEIFTIKLFGTLNYITGSFLFGWYYARLLNSDRIRIYPLLLIIGDSLISMIITLILAKFFNIFDLYIIHFIQFIISTLFDLTKIIISCFKTCLIRIENQIPKIPSEFKIVSPRFINRVDGNDFTDFCKGPHFNYRNYHVKIGLSRFEHLCYILRKLLEYFKDRFIRIVLTLIFFGGAFLFHKYPELAYKLQYLINIICSFFIDNVWEQQGWLKKSAKRYFGSRWWACFIAWLLGLLIYVMGQNHVMGRKKKNWWFNFLWYLYVRMHFMNFLYVLYILMILSINQN